MISTLDPTTPVQLGSPPNWSLLFQPRCCPPPGCVSTLPAGDYTVVLTELTAIPWNVSIDSDVPVELQVFTIE
jgi:hypothetical protein